MSLRSRARAVGASLVLRLAGFFAPSAVAAVIGAPLQLEPPKSPRKAKKRTRRPATHTRWIQSDVESAQHRAGCGDLSRAAQLCRAMHRDGLILGLITTLTLGIVRLPKLYTGDADAVAYLQGIEGETSRFEQHFPSGELARFAEDIRVLGLGIGELVNDVVQCREVVRFVRLDPEFLRYQWHDDSWWYLGALGEEQIVPGNGRWVMHLSSRIAPWDNGLWPALARAFVSKEHAFFYRENFNAKLAHPARAAVSPAGAPDSVRRSFLQDLISWGINNVIDLPPGWDVKMVEIAGRGYESFRETIADSNQEIMVSIAGQVVTVTGGSGFANADIHATIRSDIIASLGLSVSETISEQALPFVLEGKVANCNAKVSWDTRKPGNRKDEADALVSVAKAVTDLTAALSVHGVQVDVRRICADAGVPIVSAPAESLPELEPANDDEALELEELGAVDEMDPVEGAELEFDASEALAARMTELGVDRCEHGRPNRCPLCNVERVRDVTVDKHGKHVWAIAWRALRRSEAAA